MTVDLSWLPAPRAWDDSLEAAKESGDRSGAWARLVALARHNLDFVQTGRLDRLLQKFLKQGSAEASDLKPIRLALLGSSTTKHLIPGIRVAGLRRGLLLDVYESDYGQYRQELMDPASPLHAFRPQFVCLAIDAHHLIDGANGNPENAIALLQQCWSQAREAFDCTVLQQTALPVFPDILGSNEHRLPTSPQTILERINAALKPAADRAGIHLLAVDKYAALDGLRAWHDPVLWHRSKQEIHPSASHLYGEYLVRLVAAQRGVSAKCLVLDLDNTLWGGVIGDDGLEGIVLGQGNAVGESHVALQRYALELKERGIILAVCSKNDEANAVLAFEQHPEMILKRGDIACFVANWTDKATNLKHIAKSLNIGIDSLVFVDDNPFERNLVRQELPQVSVPELPEDPGLYVQCLAAAGYFEALTLTEEDRQRAEQYQMNAAREALRDSATDMESYLRGMEMELLWKPFDEIGLQRVVQLINKTNQFNLMTRRYSDAEVRTAMADPDVLTWQIRLKDKFGDNGIICILIAKLDDKADLLIDTWLMSCRVLGRQVEEACLNLLVEGGRRLGARRLLGEYQKTSKNAMVADLYGKLGFSKIGASTESIDRWALDLSEFNFRETHITVLGEA